MNWRWEICLSVAIFLNLVAFSPALAVDPCTDSGKKEIQSLNRFSKPALGSLDELPAGTDPLDPKIPAAVRLKSIDSANHHADQCRAVLGPLPPINCLNALTVPITHDGKPLSYRDGVLSLAGMATDPSLLWSCDTPELLPFLMVNPMDHPAGKGSNQGCVPNVRIGHVKSGPVDWIYLCHYHTGLHEPQGDLFDFVAMIGSNSRTGETCFFAHDAGKTNGVDVPTPGGINLHDSAGRAKAAAFWNRPSRNTCIRCHANNKPWAVTPYLNQSRLGGDGTMDFVPEVPLRKRLSPGWGYRIIGTVHNLVMKRPKAIWPRLDNGTADSTCTRCHVVNDTVEYLRLSRESVGLSDLPRYEVQTHIMPHTRHPWMPMDADPSDPGTRAEAQTAVQRLERAVFDPKFRVAEKEILSPCPAPAALPSREITLEKTEKGIRSLRWNYQNDYGQVAERDDVRIALTLEGSDGSRCQFRDLAPLRLGDRKWLFRHPLKTGVQYTYRLQPYRYCFDRKAYETASTSTISEIGVKHP